MITPELRERAKKRIRELRKPSTFCDLCNDPRARGMIRCDCGEYVDAVLAEIAAAGYVVVPKEPTEAMLNAGDDATYCGNDVPFVYRAMLAAAPLVGEG